MVIVGRRYLVNIDWSHSFTFPMLGICKEYAEKKAVVFAHDEGTFCRLLALPVTSERQRYLVSELF